MTDLRTAAQQVEKLDPMVDRLWTQLDSGLLKDAWQTAMLLSKELIGLRNELRCYREREKTMGRAE